LSDAENQLPPNRNETAPLAAPATPKASFDNIARRVIMTAYNTVPVRKTNALTAWVAFYTRSPVDGQVLVHLCRQFDGETRI
jgi:hypothetical protein